jgi:hypothetical protein
VTGEPLRLKTRNLSGVDGTRTRAGKGRETPRNQALRRGARRAIFRETVAKVRFRDIWGAGSRPFAQRVTELEAAIANVTRALGRAADEAVELLVAERAEMRAELSALIEQSKAGNVVVLDHRRD